MTKITWAASAGAAAAAAAAASLDGDLMTRRVIEERKTKVHAHTALLIKADILQFIFFSVFNSKILRVKKLSL